MNERREKYEIFHKYVIYGYYNVDTLLKIVALGWTCSSAREIKCINNGFRGSCRKASVERTRRRCEENVNRVITEIHCKNVRRAKGQDQKRVYVLSVVLHWAKGKEVSTHLLRAVALHPSPYFPSATYTVAACTDLGLM